MIEKKHFYKSNIFYKFNTQILMKKKVVFGGVATLVVAVVVAWNLNISLKADGMLSDIALANLEALANNENDEQKVEIIGLRDLGRIQIPAGPDWIDGYYDCRANETLCLGTGSYSCAPGTIFADDCYYVGTAK
jgi:hypothetical protein